MHKRMKPMIVAALMIVLEPLSPILLAQEPPPNSGVARGAASSTAEGRILWQYNTHG